MEADGERGGVIGSKVPGMVVVLVVLGVMMGVTLWVWFLRPSEEGWKVWRQRAATNEVSGVEGGQR